MTFEEWWEGRVDKQSMDKLSAQTAFEWAWGVAKEDSKPTANIVFDGRWFISGEFGMFWDSEEGVSMWAIENGYRLKY